MIIRLEARKNRFSGDAIARSCSCVRRSGTSLHVPKSVCPVHVLWPWIERRVVAGSRVFGGDIVKNSSYWINIALEARDIPFAKEYTLHSPGRGSAQALVQSGGDLSTLLQAGGWRSSAFRAYLDLVGLENRLFTASADRLLDLDESLDGEIQ